MALTREEVDHIAELAKLGLSDAEKEIFREQLSAILDYAQRLQALDTDAIPPTAHVIPLQNVMAPDQVRPSFPVEDILANAPARQDGWFQVKAVLE